MADKGWHGNNTYSSALLPLTQWQWLVVVVRAQDNTFLTKRLHYNIASNWAHQLPIFPREVTLECTYNMSCSSKILVEGTPSSILHEGIHSQTAREEPMKKTALHDFISCTSVTLTWSPCVSPCNLSPDCSSDTGPVISFQCQTNGFAMRYKGVVAFEPGWRGSGGHCMILVTRYLLVRQVESEVNNNLRLSLLGSDSINGLYK